MKTVTRNRIGMVLLLLLASTSMAFSQGLFKIIEGLSDQSLKTTMETNVNSMMMAMNTAANQNAKTVKLNKDNFTSEAIKDIEQMWKSSAIFWSPPKAYAVAMQPLMRLQQVIELGMLRVMMFAICVICVLLLFGHL